MQRRTFLFLLVATAVVPPWQAHAQERNLPVIGLLASGLSTDAPVLAGFRAGLRDGGYVEGRNVAIISLSAGRGGRPLDLAAEITRRQVAVIYAVGNNATLTAKAGSTTVPIVFSIGGDPVALGIVDSLNRPGGNVTGATNLNAEIETKRIGLMAELMPDATTIGFLVNPNSPTTADKIHRVRAAATVLHRKLEVLNAANETEVENAFGTLAEQNIHALVVTGDVFLNTQSERIAALTGQYARGVISPTREAPASGGLMSYGPSITDTNRQAGIYVSRILRGEKPMDLPVIQPTRFEFVINLKTAKMLGLTLPPGLLAIADEVIE